METEALRGLAGRGSPNAQPGPIVVLVHLIRHGETDWNVLRRVQGQMESRLTSRGRQQAEELGKRLKSAGIGRVFCSTSQRARETAAILFPGHNPEVAYLDELREIHLGPWEGQLYADLEATHPQPFHHFWNQPHLFSVEGAESFAELQRRGINVITDLYQQFAGEEIAVVSHGALLKSILCHFEGRDLSRLWDPPAMHNCAHSLVQMDSGSRGRILRYADIDFDPDQQRTRESS